MKRIAFGSSAWRGYLASLPRASRLDAAVESAVARVLRDVRKQGDAALVRYSRRFDGFDLSRNGIRVPAAEVRASARRADPALVASLRAMAKRIEAFHRQQKGRGFQMPLGDGSLLEEVVGPIDSAGLYVPGGAGAYPSSVLMTAIPARVAGVARVVVVTPPRALEANPAVAAALVVAKLESSVFRVGGAQAIAALAYGTESLARVSKIVGPGNAYVAAAKRQVRGVVETDGEAGPSEVVILADDSADARLVAADLLAQAEHGSGDETAVLVTTARALADAVAELVGAGVATVANPARARRALVRYGASVIVKDLAAGVRAVNALAAEHVEVMARGAAFWAKQIVAGAVFVGRYSPVAAGDYGVGPNHVLPTGGSARFRSPLSVRDFERRSSRVTLSERGLRRIAKDVERVAHAEGFPGHALSVAARWAS